MLGFGMGEILIVAVVVLLVVGPDNLPKFARSAGKMYGQLRRAADDMRRALVLEADRQDAEDRYKDLQERRRQREAERAAAEAASPGVAAQEPELPPPPAPPEGEQTHDEPEPHSADAARDDDLMALLKDPTGPYATGRSLDEVARAWKGSAPGQPAQDAPDAAAAQLGRGGPLDGPDPADDPMMRPPPGVTLEEWAELPPKIRQMLRSQRPESS